MIFEYPNFSFLNPTKKEIDDKIIKGLVYAKRYFKTEFVISILKNLYERIDELNKINVHITYNENGFFSNQQGTPKTLIVRPIKYNTINEKRE